MSADDLLPRPPSRVSSADARAYRVGRHFFEQIVEELKDGC